jgi:WD40 repeat protein/type II secretory pathway predicted ATPase ExeA
MENLSGRIIKGYELRKLIGQGGFGAVYLATQRLIGREVAVKIILPQYANQPDFIRRFETEAQLIARLEHPHIVPLYDYWREPSGAYLVMRYLRAGSLSDSVRESGPWAPERVAEMLAQIASALAVAHRQNVIHRDLKPENILLDDLGNAYLSDFGIAKDLGGRDELTQKNALIGSPAYISPEQIRGEPVTPQSDIYMLGLMLYELLTGVHPFAEFSAASLLYKQLTEPLPDPGTLRPELPGRLNLVIQRATTKIPADRYADVLELATDFRRGLRDGMIGATGAADNGTLVMTTATVNLPEPENPYKGLRAFQQADAADFFGREVLLNRLLARLQENGEYSRFLAVVGPSGSGKSSVVKAGLIPSLQRGLLPGSESWFIIEMVPGIDPMEELEAALLRIAVNPPDSLLHQLNEDERGFVRAVKRILPDDDTELLLVIDQFEELFTLVDDEGLRTRFMNAIIAAVMDPRSRTRVITTLRADFYDKPLNYGRFGELMQRRTEIVLPMNAEEIERAINGPAERAGLTLERGLATSIVADVNEQPGALPLLQYALTELFERRDGRVLTTAAYQEMGGTYGALARRAEELYTGIGDEGEQAARQLFLRLVTLGEGTEDTRRRAQYEEMISIGDPEIMSMVIDGFGRYRLLTFDRDPGTRQPTVEVAHEALIRQWTRLRDWLDESREDLRTQRRLSIAAEEWRHAGQEPSFLARGSRLTQFEEWAATTTLALNLDEREFLERSIQARADAQAAERARQEREEALEQRSRTRLRQLVGVLAVALIVAVALTLFAVSESSAAQRAREEEAAARQVAEDNEAQAQALALASYARTALIEGNQPLGLSLAIEASRSFVTPPVEVLRVLSGAAYGPGFVHRLNLHNGSVTAGAISPDGKSAVSASGDGTLRLWDFTSGDALVTISGEGEFYTSVAFSPDGRWIAAGEGAVIERRTATDGRPSYVNRGEIDLFDTETGTPVNLLDAERGHSDIVTAVAFTGDGRYLLSASLDRTMILWDLESGQPAQRFLTPPTSEDTAGAVITATVSADGRYALSGHADETILNIGTDRVDRKARIWDTATGSVLHVLDPRLGFIRGVDFNPQGTQALTASWSGSQGGVVSIWDVESGALVKNLFVDASVISSARFSPDGRHVLVGGWGRILSIWSIQTGTQVTLFEGFGDRILNVGYDLTGHYAYVAVGNYGNNELGVDFDRPADSALYIIDLRDRSELFVLDDHQDWVWEVDISADGRYAASAAGGFNPPVKDARVLLWDFSTGEVVRQFGTLDLENTEGHTGTVDGVAFNSDASLLLSGGWDRRLILWDVNSGAKLRELTGHAAEIYTVDISPDDRYAASADKVGAIILWDLETGEEVRRFRRGHASTTAINHLTFSPDGASLLTSGDDQQIVLWDVATGEVLRKYEGHDNRVNTVEFSPDGSLIASTSWDTSVRLWDVATGQQIRQFVGHVAETFGIAFSPDGRLLLSGSADQTVRLWDIETGDEVRRLTGHTSWIQSVRYHPSGELAISAAQDNTLRIWRVSPSPDAIIEFAQARRYVRDLTCDERLRYRLEPGDACS